MIKIILKFLLVYTIFGVIFYLSGYSQCSNCNSNYPSGTFTKTDAAWSNITTCQYGGEYSYATLSSGYIYQWNTFGTSYDTQLTLYPSGTCANTSTIWHPGPYVLAYNDDYSGAQSLMAYTPGTSSVRLLNSLYSCSNNTTCGNVAWRAIPSTPTISGGSTTICNGQSVTLSANNLSGFTNDAYIDVQWGTSSGGTQVSSDAASVTVSPTTTTTYYLRYVVYAGGTPGTQYSNVTSTTITVNQPPTAPTGISGTTTICSGNSTTLTATGGSTGSGCSYQWYEGGCGSGSVLGTGSSLTVSPTSTTTYYVRRVGSSPCNGTVTSCASVTVTVNTLSVVPTSINATVH